MDKSLDIFLMVFFGVGGMVILLFAWLQPMVVNQRILATFAGATGLIWVLIRALIIRGQSGKRT